MEMQRGTITVLDYSTGEIQIEVIHGLSAEARKRGKYRLGEGITGQVVATERPVIVPIISEDPRFLNRTRSRGALQKKETSFLCVPIKAGSKLLGALSVDKQFEGEEKLKEDLRFLMVVAALVAQTVHDLLLMQEEKKKLEEENIRLKEKLREKYDFLNIVGKSKKMEEVFEMIERVAKSDATVLLRGESGTGKELVANVIHYDSPRANKAFIKISCAALPENLMESELFGYEKGAFTGAYTTKKGQFELAQGGTVFLIVFVMRKRLWKHLKPAEVIDLKQPSNYPL